MTVKLPYLTAPGTIDNALKKIAKAKTPSKFTQDYVERTLKIKGGAGKAVPPFLKKIGFLESDGSPTSLYSKYRNPKTRGEALARALQIGYAPLFEADETCWKLKRPDLEGLIVEVTGLEHDSRALTFITSAFEKLQAAADFGKLAPEDDPENDGIERGGDPTMQEAPPPVDMPITAGAATSLGLTYQINLVLPNTDDPAVFNAIFRALKDNLIR